jgi:hypothetical protein
MNYEDDDIGRVIRREALFALEREARRYGFVGEPPVLRHPELSLRLVIECQDQ